MKLLNIFKNFKNDEAGAVTVDYVILTAAVVGLAAIVGATLTPAMQGRATAVAATINP